MNEFLRTTTTPSETDQHGFSPVEQLALGLHDGSAEELNEQPSSDLLASLMSQRIREADEQGEDRGGLLKMLKERPLAAVASFLLAVGVSGELIAHFLRVQK